jgi:N-acylneuraminate cytidylyltransferase
MEPVLRLQGMTDCQSQPRQLLPPVYWQNGYVDVLRPRAVFEKNSMWGDTVLPFVVKMGLFDLDYPEDIGPMEEALSRLEHSLDAALESPERHPV